MTLDDLIQGERVHQRQRVYRLIRLAVLTWLAVASVLIGRMLH